MTDTNELDAFNFAFDPMLDPMGGGMTPDDGDEDTPGPFTENVEGRSEFLPPDPDRIPVVDHGVKQDSEEYAARPAADRTRQLFEQLKSQRSILVGMVEAARTPASIDDIEHAVEDLRERRFTMYSTANLCSMLETAGAFLRVTEDGKPYSEVVIEPDVVVEDGEEYWVALRPPKVCWVSTDAAFEVCDSAGFQDKLEALFDEESELLPIYKRVLAMTAAEGGAAMSDLSAAVDSNPLADSRAAHVFRAAFRRKPRALRRRRMGGQGLGGNGVRQAGAGRPGRCGRRLRLRQRSESRRSRGRVRWHSLVAREGI